MKLFLFTFEFHWSLFLRVQLPIRQHWFRWWLGAEPMLTQLTDTYMRHKGGGWVNFNVLGESSQPWYQREFENSLWILWSPLLQTTGDNATNGRSAFVQKLTPMVLKHWSRLWQNGPHFADGIFKLISFNKILSVYFDSNLVDSCS